MIGATPPLSLYAVMVCTGTPLYFAVFFTPWRLIGSRVNMALQKRKLSLKKIESAIAVQCIP
jgi:hypothetical protein